MQLSTLRYWKGTSDLFKLTYNYGTGNNGQIQGITDNVDNGRSATYTYDAWSRLKTAVTTGSTSYPQWGLSWDYDRYGNLKNQNVTHGTAPALSLGINPLTNRISDTGFSYDSSGNLTADALNTYTYDAEGRIIQAKQGTTVLSTSTYDGGSLRVKKLAGSTTTRYVFSGTKVVAEYVNGSLNKEYIYGGSQLLATLNSSGTPTYHHPDHLSIRVNTNSSGTVIGQQGHYPFGESWYAQSTTTKWQFTSYERDPESSLDYAIFRYHSSRLGRFMTPDPIAGSIRNPQSLNRYSYVLNDPTNRVDPLGLCALWCIFYVQYDEKGNEIGAFNTGKCWYDCAPLPATGPMSVGPSTVAVPRPVDTPPGRNDNRPKTIESCEKAYKKCLDNAYEGFGTCLGETVVGSALFGALIGAATGSAVPGAGTAAGAGVGALGGGLSGLAWGLASCPNGLIGNTRKIDQCAEDRKMCYADHGAQAP
jgi:RHS repeat-associated protein